MNIHELKQYINNLLGNSLRLLLPSYWWKRAFGAVIDEIDKKVSVENIKTVNNDSIVGEGDIHIGFQKTDIKKEHPTDAQIGDVVSVVSPEIEKKIPICDIKYPHKILKKISVDGEDLSFVTIQELFKTTSKIRSLSITVPENKKPFLLYFISETIYPAMVIATEYDDSNKYTMLALYQSFDEYFTETIYNEDKNIINQEVVDKLNSILNSKDFRLVQAFVALEGGEKSVPYGEPIADLLNYLGEFIKVTVIDTDNSYVNIKSNSDVWEKLAKEHITSDKYELNNFSVSPGNIASVTDGGDRFRVNIQNCYIPKSIDDIISDWDKLTRVVVANNVYSITSTKNPFNHALFLNSKTDFLNDTIKLCLEWIPEDGGGYYSKNVVEHYTNNGNTIKRLTLIEFNQLLKKEDYRVAAYMVDWDAEDILHDLFDYIPKLYYDTPIKSSDVYVKSDTWEKLAKEITVTSEAELYNSESSAGMLGKVINTVTKYNKEVLSSFYQLSDADYNDGGELTEDAKNKCSVVQKLNLSQDIIDPTFNLNLDSTSNYPTIQLSFKDFEHDCTIKINISFYRSHDYAKLEYIKYIFLRGTEQVEEKSLFSRYGSSYTYEDRLNLYFKFGNFRFLSRNEKSDLTIQNNYSTLDSIFYIPTSEDTTSTADVYIKGDSWERLLKEGDVIEGGGEVTIDSGLSDTSKNPVQNKVITEALNNKADKTAIPTKTSQLTNNSGFLTQHQDISHLASKTYVDEKDATKQEKLVSGTSIKTINGNSILGSGDIKVVADTSNLATKSEVNAKQDEITDLETIRSGAAKGATAIQKVKTINGESLVGDGDVAVVTKTLYDNLVEETVANEEVYAAAVNDLNTRLNTTNITLNTTIETTESIITDINTLTTRVSDNEEVTATSYNELNERINNNYQEGVNTYATKTALNNEVVSINTAIVENEEVIAATLNDLLSQIEALRVRVEQLENA